MPPPAGGRTAGVSGACMSQMSLQPVAMPFPVRGVNDGQGLANQAEGTCADARNVRTFESLEDRARGGQRPGLVKAFATEMDGPALDIGVVVLPSPDSDAIDGLQETLLDLPNGDGVYVGGDTIDTDPRITTVSDPGESGATEQLFSTRWLRLGGNVPDLYFREASSSSNFRTDAAVVEALAGLGTAYEMSVTFTNTSGANNFQSIGSLGLQVAMGFAVRVSSDYTDLLELGAFSIGGGGTSTRYALFGRTNGSQTTEVTGPAFDQFSLGVNFPITDITFTIQANGDDFKAFVFADGMSERFEILSGSTSLHNTNTGIVWGIEGSADFTERISRVLVTGAPPAPFGRRTVYVIPQTGSNAYIGNLSDDSTRSLTPITSGSGTFLAKSGNIASMSLFNKLYSVNGTEGTVIDPVAGTIENWVATAGTRPDGYLTAAFRGSAVIAADPDDPNNLYMSAVEDPLDWDYGAEPIETSAFALDSSDLGKNADPIIALATWSDDYMLLGGASTLRVITGDPRAGGRLDTITQSLGVIGPRAVCVDPQGQLYFMGNDGLYRMPFGSTQPTSLSSGRLDSYLRDINLSTTKVEISYDSQRAAIHIWIQPIVPTVETVHVLYSIREDAFWLDEFATVDLDPTASVSVYGDASDTRNVVIGCRDSFLRRFDEDAKSDDGEIISSYVRYSPILAGGGMMEAIIRELQIETARGSDAMTWTMRAADSAEELADNANVRTRTGTLAATTAFQPPKRFSLRYAAAQLEIANAVLDESWAVERSLIRERPGGRRRA